MSRGACIRDHDLPPVRTFALRVRNLFYFDSSGYCWTSQVNQAKVWTDRSIPEGIVERWNKKTKRDDDATMICGIAVAGSVEVVDVTHL